LGAKQNLAVNLGFAEDARLLIINCDDLGSSHAANAAIRRAIGEGAATSATLMVPCPWAREGIEIARGLDVGVHLTLTSEYPFYRWRSLTGGGTLHDREGYLPRTAAEVWAGANLNEVEEECRAQVRQALEWGVDITHLDAHMGTMQIDPRFFALYLKIASEFRLPLRMVSERHETQLGFDCRGRARSMGIVFPDNFISPVWGTPARGTLMRALETLRAGISEIYLHPVEDGPELRGYDLEAAALRADDYACLMDPEVKALAKRNGILPLSFRPLRDLMRANTQSMSSV